MCVRKMLHGVFSTVDSGTYTDATWRSLMVKCSGSSIKVWVEGALTLDETDADVAWGAAGLGGWQAKFKNVRIGYDNNADDDIDDAGDDVVFNDGFNGTSITLDADHDEAPADAWDKNGNMILDGDFAYVYDAWNNLVAVKSQADADVAYATYRFFADDRRASKAVTHRGELDTTLYFLYDGPEVIEERDGSEAVVQQYVYGPRHIDDLAMIRGRNGTSFVHTDANWNVIGLTTPAATNMRWRCSGLRPRGPLVPCG
jgi:hypothetical protein